MWLRLHLQHAVARDLCLAVCCPLMAQISFWQWSQKRQDGGFCISHRMQTITPPIRGPELAASKDIRIDRQLDLARLCAVEDPASSRSQSDITSFDAEMPCAAWLHSMSSLPHRTTVCGHSQQQHCWNTLADAFAAGTPVLAVTSAPCLNIVALSCRQNRSAAACSMP